MNDEPSKTASVEELYVREKKKATIFMAGTAVFAMLFVGSLIIDTGGSATTDQTLPTDSQQRGAGGGRGQQQSIASFFDESGELDQAAVDSLAERFNQTDAPAGVDSSQFLDRFIEQIDTAVTDGEITSAQAADLTAALETASSEV